MAKQCDHTSVGVIAEEDGRSAMIFRKNYPEAWAMIAGHIDRHGEPGEDILLQARKAALAEAKEEGGLKLGRFVKVFSQEEVPNSCKRDDGTHHQWFVFEAYDWTGTLRPASDAVTAKWVSYADLQKLARTTEYFAKKYGKSPMDVAGLTHAIFGDPKTKTTDTEWLENPGLEPVWYYILKMLGKI